MWNKLQQKTARQMPFFVFKNQPDFLRPNITSSTFCLLTLATSCFIAHDHAQFVGLSEGTGSPAFFVAALAEG